MGRIHASQLDGRLGQAGCYKKGCKLTWEEHLDENGVLLEHLQDETHRKAGTSGLVLPPGVKMIPRRR